jgi:hypothetical protein
LKRAHHRGQRPVRHKLFDRLLQPIHSFLRKSDRLDHFLQDDLMSGMIELLFLQPSQVPHRPTLLAREDTTVLEHEGAHLLPMHSKRLDR